MYVFARLLLLNFVSDASFVHPRLEVEHNYTAASCSSLLSKNSSKSPLVPYLVPLFHSLAPALRLPPTRTPPEHAILFHHHPLIVTRHPWPNHPLSGISRSLLLVRQRRNTAHAMLYDVSRTCPGIGRVPLVRRRDGGIRVTLYRRKVRRAVADVVIQSIHEAPQIEHSKPIPWFLDCPSLHSPSTPTAHIGTRSSFSRIPEHI